MILTLCPGSNPHGILDEYGLDHCCFGSSLVPVVSQNEDIQIPCLRSPCHCSSGIIPQCLQPLDQAPRRANGSAPTMRVLVNARSLANKKFILNDFFTSCGLGFLCVAETWLRVSESSLFSEVLPLDCRYFNNLRTTERGGGVATVMAAVALLLQLQTEYVRIGLITPGTVRYGIPTS